MCKNNNVDIPNNYPSVEPSSDYSEVTNYDRDDETDYSEYYDVPKDLLETIDQAIIDANKDDDDDNETDDSNEDEDEE